MGPSESRRLKVELFQICRISFHPNNKSSYPGFVSVSFVSVSFSYLTLLFHAVSHAVFGSLGNYFPIDPLILVASIMAPVSPLQSQKTIAREDRKDVRVPLPSAS